MNRPPKNMISVSRNSHMPKLAVSRCCSTVTKWWRRYDGCASCSSCPVAIAWLSNGRYLVFVLKPLVVVRFVIHNRNLNEILGQGRRLGFPFKASRLPRIVAGNLAVLERPGHVEHRE